MDAAYKYFLAALEKKMQGRKNAELKSAISEGFLSQVRNGKKRASPKKQAKVANYFGMSVDEFIKIGEPDPPPEADTMEKSTVEMFAHLIKEFDGLKKECVSRLDLIESHLGIKKTGSNGNSY